MNASYLTAAFIWLHMEKVVRGASITPLSNMLKFFTAAACQHVDVRSAGEDDTCTGRSTICKPSFFGSRPRTKKEKKETKMMPPVPAPIIHSAVCEILTNSNDAPAAATWTSTTTIVINATTLLAERRRPCENLAYVLLKGILQKKVAHLRVARVDRKAYMCAVLVELPVVRLYLLRSFSTESSQKLAYACM